MPKPRPLNVPAPRPHSTLGMVVHWSRAQRQQHGRSSAQLEGIRQMPCPDLNGTPPVLEALLA
ncbi:MAG: hypothetical protein OXG76_14360 [Acidimicrobiaceae bacterium]|nr:hypothetical protein [Acidimicrobiaceae bacterium]